jgi:hypothetical protein
MSESSSQYWTYFDEAWKQIIERFFPQFMRFFVPELHEAIDFQHPEFLRFFVPEIYEAIDFQHLSHFSIKRWSNSVSKPSRVVIHLSGYRDGTIR